MAMLASVYSVDRYVRTADDVVAALFRDERDRDKDNKSRPRPCHKRMAAFFPTVEDAGSDDQLRIPAEICAWSWAARERPGCDDCQHHLGINGCSS